VGGFVLGGGGGVVFFFGGLGGGVFFWVGWVFLGLGWVLLFSRAGLRGKKEEDLLDNQNPVANRSLL